MQKDSLQQISLRDWKASSSLVLNQDNFFNLDTCVPYFPHALSALSTAVFYLVVDMLHLKLLSSPHLLNSADLLVSVRNESTELPPSLK